MTLPADFTIDGDPSANRGYAAVHDQVLTLQLEVAPTTDIGKVEFSADPLSKGAPALVFSPASGQPATPGGSVDVTMPSTGVHSWIIRCQVNNGIDPDSKVVSGWTTYRMVSILSTKGMRKMVPRETTEFEAPDGWTGAFNDMVDEVEDLGYNLTAVKTSEYNAVIGDLVRVDPIDGAFNVVLPSAVGLAGKGITVKNVTSDPTAVTLVPDGSEEIDAQASTQLAAAFGTVTVISDGADWMRFPPV